MPSGGYNDIFAPTWSGAAGQPGTLGAIPIGTAPTIVTGPMPGTIPTAGAGVQPTTNTQPGGVFNMFQAPGYSGVTNPATSGTTAGTQGNPYSNPLGGGVFDMFNSPGVRATGGMGYISPVDRITRELTNNQPHHGFAFNGLFGRGR